MDSSVVIFVAHAEEDATLALLLKEFLEGIFLNASVFVSGTGLVGGAAWFETLRQQLDRATAILAIITPRSKNNPWVLFESGAGVCSQKSIPVLTNGVTFDSLEPPLSFLQGRCYSADGLRQLTEDIAKMARLRTPTKFPDIDRVIAKVQEVTAGQRSDAPTAKPELTRSTCDKEASANDYDPELARLFLALHKRAATLLITSIERSRATFEIPPRHELETTHPIELCEIAHAVNAVLPILLPLSLRESCYVPQRQDPIWRKMNARKRLEALAKDLDEFEASLGLQGRPAQPNWRLPS